MNVEFRDAYETQSLIIDEMQNKIEALSKSMIDDSDETIEVISNLNASDNDIKYIKKMVLTTLMMVAKIIDVSQDISEYIITHREVYPKFNNYMTASNNAIKSLNNSIKHIRYVMNSYIDGLDYIEIPDGRRFFSSPFHDKYVDILIFKNVLTIYFGNKSFSYKLDVPKLKLKDEFQLNEISIPKSLGVVTTTLFQEISHDDIYVSPPLNWSIYKLVLKWYFENYILTHRRYENYLINHYSEVLVNNIKTRDMKAFQDNNVMLLGMMEIAQCPMIYDKIHEKIIQKM